MSALKRLQHRNWQTLRDIWIGHLPTIDFDSLYPEPTLAQLPSITHPPLNASGLAEIDYIDGIREAIFREAVLLSRKFIYCASLLPTLSDAGKITWTAMAAYEATFYGAKAVCFFLGLAPLNRSSKSYVDAFFETEKKIGKNRVKSYDILRIHGLGDRLTHEILWSLTVRLLDTTTFDGERREIQTKLKLIDWDRFSSFRNTVFYDGSFWPLSTDMEQCDIVRPRLNSQVSNCSFLDAASIATPFADEYFAVATLLRRLILSMLQSIADIAPAVQPEVDAYSSLARSAQA